MAEELLAKYHNQIAGITLHPSSGGVFEIMVGEQLVFSKKQSGHFPKEGEVERAVLAMISR